MVFQGLPVFSTARVGSKRALSKLALAFILAAAGALAGPLPAAARDTSPLEFPDQAVVALAALPPQAQQTHRLILNGGPFPYAKDGTVFQNRERRLPLAPRGMYREYTVKTPGARDRGARRIVCGGLQPTQPQDCYYTADHYTSFRRIVY